MKLESLWLSSSPWTVVEGKENNVKAWLVENLNSSLWTRSSYSMLHFACSEWLLTSVSWLMICLQDDLVELLPFGYKSEFKGLAQQENPPVLGNRTGFFWAVRGQWKIGPIFLFLGVATLTKFCVANLFLDSIL